VGARVRRPDRPRRASAASTSRMTAGDAPARRRIPAALHAGAGGQGQPPAAGQAPAAVFDQCLTSFACGSVRRRSPVGRAGHAHGDVRLVDRRARAPGGAGGSSEAALERRLFRSRGGSSDQEAALQIKRRLFRSRGGSSDQEAPPERCAGCRPAQVPSLSAAGRAPRGAKGAGRNAQVGGRLAPRGRRVFFV
jgi:hypothetical protein